MIQALPPLSLYIHIPWCVRKCPYCDFNSHNQPDALPVDDYITALMNDLTHDLPWVQGRSIDSIFFGGGTPSLFSASAMKRIIQGVRGMVPLSSSCEITMECNPGTTEHDRFAAYRDAGINRLSFGVQSFDDAHLHGLGRIHDSKQAITAIQTAKKEGFERINIDLMYALPKQTTAQALADLEQAIALEPQHISHYQLTIEPNTLFAAQPPKHLPHLDDAFAMQDACQALLAQHGFAQYEVSAYARAGERCRHNVNYWRFGDYLGIGAGAHGKITDLAQGCIIRTAKQRHPRTYIDRCLSLTNQSLAEHKQVDRLLEAHELPYEFMMNRLRLDESFSIHEFTQRTGLSVSVLGAPKQRAIELELLNVHADQWRVTPHGKNFLNDLVLLFMNNDS